MNYTGIEEICAYPEMYLQKIARQLLCEAGRSWPSVEGPRVQFISAGEWNPDAGPDFLNLAVLAEGQTITGHGEFHKRSSQWRAHGHHKDARYAGLVAHIVLLNDCADSYARYTVCIDPDEMRRAIAADSGARGQRRHGRYNNAATLEALQDYTMRRLMRKRQSALELCRAHGLPGAMQRLLREFLDKQGDRKQRPLGPASCARELLNADNAAALRFLQSVAARDCPDIGASLRDFTERRIAAEGRATRVEIVVNVLLPLTLALGNGGQRTQALGWFWSLKAPNVYGALRRRFPQIDQKYVWQQQGILEYYLECRLGRDYCADLLFPYVVTPQPAARWHSAPLSA